MKQNTLFCHFFDTPIGTMRALADKKALYFLDFSNDPVDAEKRFLAIFKQTEREISEYFAGKRTSFSVPYRLPEVSPFRMSVWRSLTRVAYGETVSYKALSALSENPSAIRATATAVKNNPLAIILPCHRIVTKSGALGGYLWGKEKKRSLLHLEKG